MPKKSNKTAHVLSLLTNGPAELGEMDTHAKQEAVAPSSVPTINEADKAETSTPVLVEIQGELENDVISDLIKKELEQELSFQEKKELSQDVVTEPTVELSKPLQEEPTTIEDVISEKFIFEEFDEEENTPMPAKLNMDDNYEPNQADETKILHNLAEDAMRIKVPQVMETFNMCTCQSCVYDVMALALNHVTPLYTVTDKGHLYQKLSSYEMQYGTDLTSAITKACIKVKINPNHINPNSNIPTNTL